MKRIGNPTFFRTFDRICSLGNPQLKLSKWTMDGVTWTKDRHAFQGAGYGFTVEMFTGTSAGRNGWVLRVVKEYWWLGNQGRDAKNRQWAHQESGKRTDMMAWLEQQEKASR